MDRIHGYSWDVYSHNDFDGLFVLEVKQPKKQEILTKFLSDHWLTQGELWSLIGLDKYGRIPYERLHESCHSVGQLSYCTGL